MINTSLCVIDGGRWMKARDKVKHALRSVARNGQRLATSPLAP